jgi:hypothetical protein
MTVRHPLGPYIVRQLHGSVDRRCFIGCHKGILCLC